MAQSHSRILVHLVFSTKNRAPLITDDIRGELNAYLVGIFRHLDSPSIITNTLVDHGHTLFSLSKNWALADVIEKVKGSSSKWIKTKGAQFADFYWQNGYGAFSIGQSGIERVKQYIANQEQHHKTVSFQDELRDLFRRYGIAFDERYVWG